MFCSPRRAAAVLVLAFLTAGVLEARPVVPVRAAAPAAEEGSLPAVWERLVSRFRFLEPREVREPRPGGGTAKAGCGMDPDGRPAPCK